MSQKFGKIWTSRQVQQVRSHDRPVKRETAPSFIYPFIFLPYPLDQKIPSCLQIDLARLHPTMSMRSLMKIAQGPVEKSRLTGGRGSTVRMMSVGLSRRVQTGAVVASCGDCETDEQSGRQAWEGMYKRSWDVVQEDEGGGLQAAVDSLIARGRRKRCVICISHWPP